MPRFRLLVGTHYQDDPFKMECDICRHRWSVAKKMTKEQCPECTKANRIHTTRFVDKRYLAGDVFDSKTDLTRMNGGIGCNPKFELVPNTTPLFCGLDERREVSEPQSPYQPGLSYRDTLEGMTVDELKKVAAEEEIDLGKAKTKEDMVKAILGTAAKM